MATPIPSFISGPIRQAQSTVRQPYKNPAPNIIPDYSPETILSSLVDLFTKAQGQAVESGLSTTAINKLPYLKEMEERVAGVASNAAPTKMTPLLEKMKGAGFDIPLYQEPQDVTEDEADQWLTARAQAFKSPVDYQQQLKKEIDSLSNLPKLHQYTAEIINLYEQKLKDPTFDWTQINPKWGTSE